jgi:hypothetical protein
MKNLLQLFFCFFLIGSMMAQDIKFPSLDKSPMDAITYPRSAAFANYLDADDPDRSPKIKVLYSRPYKNERNVFGELLKFGVEWRLGANENTEISFYQNVEIDGVMIPRGTYTMFADVNQDNWVFKFSKQRHTAGTTNRDKSQDIASVKVMTSETKEVREQMTIGFQKVNEGNVNMIVEWDDTRAELPINLYAPTMEADDKSPMDLVAYPARSKYQNHLKAEEIDANVPKIRVLYSRPQANGRKIFGELLPYGEMWRLGANQTTTVTFYQPVSIGGTDLRAGTYGIFAKANENDWDFIVHKNVQSWGHPNHDDADNIVTVKAATAKTPSTLEALSVVIDEVNANEVHIVFGWEDTMAKLPVMIK